MALSDTQRSKMINTRIPSLVTSMAIPTVVSQLINLIYNTADTYFISQINKSASAAVGAVFSIMALIQAVGFGFSMGSQSICSRKLGENNDKEADKTASSALLGAIVLGAFMGLLGLLLLNPLLTLIGCSETMLPYARSYAICILSAAPISCSMFIINGTLRAEGHTSFSMVGMLISAVTNTIMDPIFIFVFGWGTFGAALSTAISQFLAAAIMLSLFLRKKTIIHLSLFNASKDLKTYTHILATGFPTICRQGLASVATAAMSKQAVVYGDAAVAAILIANKCYMLVRNVVLGFGQGFMPVAGYNYGAGKKNRTKEAFYFTCKVGSVICIVGAILIAVFANNIMWWFCKDEGVLLYGVSALYFASAAMPVMAFSTYVNQLYQCLGFKLEATILACCRQGIFFLPCIFLLPALLGVTGVQMAQPTADCLTFLISIPFMFKMVKKNLKD